MPVSSETARNDYTGNGATATYDFTFSIVNNADLQVTQRATNGVESSPDYTLSLNDDRTGSITLDAGSLPDEYALVIRRYPAITQPISFRDQREFFASRHEDAYDRIVHICQTLAEGGARSIIAPVTEGGFDAQLPSAESRASRILGFDENGNVTTYPLSDSGGLAAGYSNIAVSSQDTLIAESADATLLLSAGSNISLATHASSDTLTVTAAPPSFSYHTSSSSYTVGDKITRVNIQMWGAGKNAGGVMGGGDNQAIEGGGAGAYCRLRLQVTPGDILGFTLGGNGTSSVLTLNSTTIATAGGGSVVTGGTCTITGNAAIFSSVAINGGDATNASYFDSDYSHVEDGGNGGASPCGGQGGIGNRWAGSTGGTSGDTPGGGSGGVSGGTGGLGAILIER